MNDRGFTLVEIIAIMVVLVGIFLVSFPILTNMIKTNEDEQYDNMVNDLCTAGKTYMYSNLDEFEQLSIVNSEIEIEISQLVLYGNVDKDLVNPKTESTVEKDKLKYTVLEDLSLDCKYMEE